MKSKTDKELAKVRKELKALDKKLVKQRKELKKMGHDFTEFNPKKK